MQCAVCGKPVESQSVYYDHFSCRLIVTVYCHRKIQAIMIPEVSLYLENESTIRNIKAFDHDTLPNPEFTQRLESIKNNILETWKIEQSRPSLPGPSNSPRSGERSHRP